MELETKNHGDLTINGFGSSNGGEFRNVVLNGKGTINNDIKCHDFECNGTGSLQESLFSQTAKISGYAKVMGNVHCNFLKVDGRAKMEQNVFVKQVKVSGSATIGGNLKGEEIKVHGRLVVDGNCDADYFKGECQFNIGGLLNADNVEIKLFGGCTAKEIGGQSIVVRQKASFMAQLFKSFFQNGLDTDLIEGDHIEIENTTAKIVRGNNVVIGPNCNIGLVEYSGTLKQDKTAVIGESKKI